MLQSYFPIHVPEPSPFGVVQWVITKPANVEGKKTILHIKTKGRRHTRSHVMCVLCCGEKNRMLCHYGKRSLGHEQKIVDERVKREEPGGEEAWKRIIAKYISSIRDAFLGLNVYGAIWWAYKTWQRWQTCRRGERNPVGFSLRFFKSLKSQMSVSGYGNQLRLCSQPNSQPNKPLSQYCAMRIWYCLWASLCNTHRLISLMRNNFANEKKAFWEAKGRPTNYAITSRRRQITSLMNLAQIYFRLPHFQWQFIVPHSSWLLPTPMCTWCAFD